MVNGVRLTFGSSRPSLCQISRLGIRGWSVQMITSIRLGKVYLELQSRIEQLAPGWQKLRNYVGTFLLDCSGGHRFSTLSTECTVLQPQHTVHFDRKMKIFEDDQFSAKIHKKTIFLVSLVLIGYTSLLWRSSILNSLYRVHCAAATAHCSI